MGFRAWLKARGLDPADLSTDELKAQVHPIR
jgi:hypothetical protein